MTLLPGLAAAIVLVWGLGGELGRIATLRFRHTALLYGAFAGQLVAFGPFRVLAERQIEQMQVATYVLLILFCFTNRHVAGIWLVGCGIVANAVVIAVNGGVMPVDPGAIVASGWTVQAYESAYPNVVAHGGAPLWFLGDVFAMPRFHGSAVLSVGDLSIIAGAWLVLQRAASPRTASSRAAGNLGHAVLPTAGVLLALLALMSARPVVVVVAFGVLGAALAPAALAVSGRRPPPLRCLSVCLILCASVVALGESIDSISTSVLAATAAGLLMGLGGLVVATSGHGRSDLGLSS
ncbi:MAG: diguanylate cyclase [Gaiellales bacterium]|jgi:hypothetical protein|nr:diguanylate cyclase [Gaiellales bacterium]